MKLAFALIVLLASPAFAEKHTIGATTFDSPPAWVIKEVYVRAPIKK